MNFLTFCDLTADEPESQPLTYQLPSEDVNEETSKIIHNLITDQIEALKEGNIPKAYFAYTSNEFRTVTSLEDFKKFINSFSVFSKNKTIDLSRVNFEKNHQASYQGTLTSTNGETMNVVYEVVLENGDWKIMGIQLIKPSHSYVKSQGSLK
jgi:hypothetical protein